MTTDAFAKAFCNRCGRENSHEVLWRGLQDREEGDGPFRRVLVEKTEVLECGGCGSRKFRLTTECPDFTTPTVHEYPAAMRRRLPIWHNDLPSKVQNVHSDIYLALQVGIPRLAVMGARAVIEMALNTALTNPPDSFSDKLNVAVTQKVLTESQKDILGAAIDAGHATVHRDFIPDDGQASHVFDIVDYLLMTVFILSNSATCLANGIPPRPTARGRT